MKTHVQLDFSLTSQEFDTFVQDNSDIVGACLVSPSVNKIISNCQEDTVKVSDITLEWASGEDICPDELYNNSTNE
jgi:hypothetical protein